MNQTCKDAVDIFGKREQTMVAIEAMGKLIQTINQFAHNRAISRDLYEAIADVTISCVQLSYIVESDIEGDYKVRAIIDEKLNRIEKNITIKKLSVACQK